MTAVDVVAALIAHMCNARIVDDIVDERTVQRALTAAHLYYVQDRTMEAIARELGTSRSTVSRLLSHARATGIVDIRITSPFAAPQLLEERLAERFGISAHVVPVPDDAHDVERLERVAVAAAHLFGDLVRADMTIGVAWGSTTAAVSRRLVPKSVHDTTFVQLNGSGNTHTTGLLYASEILSRFAAAYGGSAQQFPVPAFFDDPGTKRAMWRERSTRRILAMHEAMDLVVFSTGSAGSRVPSHVYSGGYLEAPGAVRARRGRRGRRCRHGVLPRRRIERRHPAERARHRPALRRAAAASPGACASCRASPSSRASAARSPRDW